MKVARGVTVTHQYDAQAFKIGCDFISEHFPKMKAKGAWTICNLSTVLPGQEIITMYAMHIVGDTYDVE